MGMGMVRLSEMEFEMEARWTTHKFTQFTQEKNGEFRNT